MRRRVAVRIAAGVVVLLAAAVAAGCGSGGAGPAAGKAEGARLVPSDTAMFVSVRAVPGSQQWQAAQTLLDRFPSGAEAVQAFLDKLANGAGEPDLEAALGDEVDLAVLDVTGGERPPTVLLTRPTDPAELERLLAAADEAPAWIVEDGWYLVAESRATLDRAIAGAEAGSLSASDRYTTALDGLPGDALASLYVSGEALKAAATSAGKQSLASLAGDVSAVGAAALAEPQGVRIEGSVVSGTAPEAKAFETTLASLVPADALAFVSFGDPEAIVDRLLEQAGAASAEAPADVVLAAAQELLPVFEGENALFVRPGKPEPEVTLLLSPADPARASSTLDTLVGLAKLAALTGQGISIESSQVDIGGIAATKLELKDEGITLYYAVVRDHLVVSTAPAGIASIAATTPRLADDPLYIEATTAAGLPSETTGFAYLDLRDGLTAAEDLGRLAGLSPEAVENLRPLQYAVISSGRSDGTPTFSGFLGIK